MAPCQGGKTLDCVLFGWNCKWLLDFLLALALFKEHFLHCMLSPVADYSPVQCFQCSWVSSINMARSSSATCKLHTHNVLRSVSPCHNCMKISVYGHIKERILSSCLKRKAKRCMHSIYNVKVQDRRKKIKIMLLFFFFKKMEWLLWLDSWSLSAWCWHYPPFHSHTAPFSGSLETEWGFSTWRNDSVGEVSYQPSPCSFLSV